MGDDRRPVEALEAPLQIVARSRGRQPRPPVIFVDSNLFVVDLRYPGDANYRLNRHALDRLSTEGSAVTSILNVLEVCGILSFNLSREALHALYVHFPHRYRVAVVPAGGYDAVLPAPHVRELLSAMERRMALKDAEIALVVEQQSANLTAFLSWNARHFAGKLSVPAMTPREWMKGIGRRRKRPAKPH
jgi:hypothetical protein